MNYLGGENDRISDLLLNFKSGVDDSFVFWKYIIEGHFKDDSFDYVIRVLSSSEISAKGNCSLDTLGETIAQFTNGVYNNGLLIKKRKTLQLKFLNKEDRKHEVAGVYKLNKKIDLSNKKVLIIDDVITTGITISEVARCISSEFRTAKIFSYCLCRTSHDLDANNEIIHF